MPRSSLILIPLVILGLLVWASTFIVDERELAIKFRLGEIVDTEFEPGLHFKLPFVNNVRFFDSRILTLDAPPERYLTSEKKNLVVDAFIKWRIIDAADYYRTTTGDERRAGTRLSQIIKNALRNQFGNRTIQEAISGERRQIMDIVRKRANAEAKDLGVEIVDVRIKRADLPPQVSTSVFQRMEKERAAVAKQFRSEGQEKAKGIRADAERQRSEILSKAYAEGQKIRGEGDARATAIYNDAFTRDEEFYAFYRSLDAYRQAFSNKNDLLVLEPDSDFFRYFGDSRGQAEQP